MQPLCERIGDPVTRVTSVSMILRTAATAVVAAVLSSCASPQTSVDRNAAPNEGDWLESAFSNPPDSARPRVWWHWMNGNVTEAGIRKDLEWMKRVGIGGLQAFEVDIQTPQIVDRRLTFMSPEWKDAFRVAAVEADRLGLEFAIAASPGFSVTGGPWVAPQDGMKKIAWSETTVEGGRRFIGTLPTPADTTGPFQDASPFSLLAPIQAQKTLPSLYQDTTVFAYRLPAETQPLALSASIAGKPLDTALLTDSSFSAGLSIPKGSPESPTIIELVLDKPQQVQTVTVFMRGAFQLFQPGIVFSRLEASVDGATWREIANLGVNLLPTTVSFPPVEATRFRLVLTKVGAGGGHAAAVRGVDVSTFDAFKPSPDVELVELRLSNEPRIDRWEVKAGFAGLPLPGGPDARFGEDQSGLAPADVIDLRDLMTPEGALDWTPPHGTWRVVRMGWSLVGATNHPAPAEGTGLEVDKLDRAAVRRYLETYLGIYRDAAGADLFGRRGVQALLTDSTEVGAFNWTPGLLDHFQRLRGYDPRPWLPALTGAIVDTRERSDSFLYDFRRTLGDLHASEHYGTVAAVAHEHGLKVYGEALEGSAGSPGDDLDMRRYADIPMAAQWTYPRDGKPSPVNEADMRGAASVAHFYGRKIVAAESLTSDSYPWAFAPADLRPTIDLVFASGVNRPVIHTSPHVPRDDMQPGLSLWIYGQYFNRLETWAEMARPWVDYIARSSLLLQAGRPVADVLYLYGEDKPVGAMSADGLPADLPRQYAYDFISANAVQTDLRVDQGDLLAPGGARYRVLQLGGSSERMTLPLLRRIAALAEEGATIVGDAPKHSPGLDGYTDEYAGLLQRLWAGGDVTIVGQGRVIAGRDVEMALRLVGVAPDFAFVKPTPNSHIMFVHREILDGEIYFVTNRSNRFEQIDARFRVTGKAPEIWRADHATIKPASYRIDGQETVVPLEIAAEESFFVVFRRDAASPSRSIAPEIVAEVAEIEGPWDVAFQPGRGAPAQAAFASLGSLSENAQPSIRYFSGIAAYTTTFDAPSSHEQGAPLFLDLGAVGDVAEVWINGHLAGTAWRRPYRVDIGPFAKAGRNELDIRIANLWVNRLIGDAQPGAAPITYTGTATYTADAPLRPSGLIGPVRLLTTGREESTGK